MRSRTRLERADSRAACVNAARDLIQGGEPLAVLIAERRIIRPGGELGQRVGQRELPMWAINERWIVVQWGPWPAALLVPFNRRSGRLALEQWRSRRPWVWVLSARSLELAREIARRSA